MAIMFYYLLTLALTNAQCEVGIQESDLVQIAQSSELIDEKCIFLALDQGWLDTAYSLILSGTYKNQEFSSSLKSYPRELKKNLDKITTLVEKKNPKFQTVYPAFQWAQSTKAIFLDIKYSHRLETSACSNIRDVDVQILPDKFFFSAKCIRSGQNVRLLLEYEHYGEIIVEDSKYTQLKSGRLSVEIKKAKEEVWDLPMKGKKPSNMHIWWEVREKYETEVNELKGEPEETKKKDDSEFDELLNNPNVVIENSYVNGKYVDNTKERGYS
ncbi:hypothetical protein SteCoe_18163 [Stentor coeruleus]|uniref:CS domain-containing protein n=1 Tax=Stentor coeruleus TaxID=5963 RepID=A0A1R2BX41_9CILI|nr:hypothetical protein SteCoe_18163 [Stentor coeruleus]